jgi:dihydrofolate synthase/folylpolyglutamate synthase
LYAAIPVIELSSSDNLELMTYDEALAFWYGRVNYEHKTPLAGDFKLERMRTLMRRLGDPQQRLRIVHVAGSKGKGSTSAMLAEILQRAGYRTGLFTSPHLVRVEERIQVNGSPISSVELTALLEDVRAAVHAGRLEPTFFEIATAAGFRHFVRQRVEIAVVEVGLGGRLDSTNVCEPLVAVITSISHDHTQMLGMQLESIAAEKAGIVKPGLPVVSGATVPEAKSVIERICRDRQAQLRQLGADFHYVYEPGFVDKDRITPPRFRVVNTGFSQRSFELALFGEHQAANAAVAITVVQCLRERGLHIAESVVAAGLAHVKWPARLEVIGRGPFVVLDCAHNVASVVALIQTITTSFPASGRLLIFACSGDKDLEGMFRVLVPHFRHVFLTKFSTSTRAVSPEELADILGRVSDIPYTTCLSASEAWCAARAVARPDDLICITGSVFLAGEMRSLLVLNENKSGIPSKREQS